MRLPLPCVECAKAKSDPKTGIFRSAFAFVEMEGEHEFRISCPEGHGSVVALQQPRYELLFESGGMAVLDGYYREAVASFAAALERLHEHSIRAMLLQAGVSAGDVESTWKQLSRQSERQFGAFLVLYVGQHSEVAPTLANKWIEFRNSVIHQGVFPKAKEALEYGEEVMRVVAQLASGLEKVAPAGMAALRKEHAERAAATGYPGEIITILGRATDLWPKLQPFTEELRLLDNRRRGGGGCLTTA
jgi:hypothetical protein